MTTKAKTSPKPRRKRVNKPKPPSAPMVRTSERTSWNACRWQWDRAFNERIKPIQEAPALRFGSLIHKALELRYPPGVKRGPKPAETFEKLYLADLKEAETVWGFRDEDGSWAEALDVGVDMMERYIERYGRDEEWQVLASEMTFKVPVMTPPADDGGYIWVDKDGLVVPITKPRVLFYYVGTMDGIWKNRMDGGVRVNDYKTCKGDPTKEAEGKLFDEQATAYWTWGVDYLVAKKILKATALRDLDGMLYTFMRKAKSDPRPQDSDGKYLNKDGSVSGSQPSPYFHRAVVYRSDEDRERARRRAIQQYIEMAKARAGTMAIYKQPGMSFPNQQCKGCGYRDICELHEVGADWESLRDATMREWDPYEAHEVEEEGKW